MTDPAHNALDEARKTARLFEEQLGVLAKQMEDSGRARRQLTERLNEAARRLRLSATEAQRYAVLVEATRDFADRAALFTVKRRFLHLQVARGLAAEPPSAIPLASAPAFAAAAESGDTIVAMRQAGELSEPIAALVGEAASGACSLFPVLDREGTPAAILYADTQSGTVDRNALELLGSIAGLSLATRPVEQPPRDPDLITISDARPPAPANAEDNRPLHLKARRFARARVAEMRLYQSNAVKKGRANRDLYTSLKQDIDSNRQAFRDAFLSASPKMVDYLHLEILRTLANNDVALLGPQYPGPMA